MRLLRSIIALYATVVVMQAPCTGLARAQSRRDGELAEELVYKVILRGRNDDRIVPGCCGTAFLVQGNGVFFTAKHIFAAHMRDHVIDPAYKIHVCTEELVTCREAEINSSPHVNIDWIQLLTNRNLNSPRTLCLSQETQRDFDAQRDRGEPFKVRAVGFPRDDRTHQRFSRAGELDRPLNNFTWSMVAQGIVTGFSGGPVLNRNGEVVGIISYIEDTIRVVPASVLLAQASFAFCRPGQSPVNGGSEPSQPGVPAGNPEVRAGIPQDSRASVGPSPAPPPQVRSTSPEPLLTPPRVSNVPLGFVTGSSTGAYFQIGTRISQIAQAENIAVEIHTSAGSAQNVNELLRPGIELAIVQGDTLIALERGGSQMRSTAQRFKRGARIVHKLYDEAVHVVVPASAPASVTSFRDLGGGGNRKKRIVAGAPGSGVRLTAEDLVNRMFDRPEDKPTLVTGSAAEGLIMLKNGEADAVLDVVRPGGREVFRWDNGGGDLRFLNVPLPQQSNYTQTRIEQTHYGFNPVSTIGIPAILVTYAYEDNPSTSSGPKRWGDICDTIKRLSSRLVQARDRKQEPLLADLEPDTKLIGWLSDWRLSGCRSTSQ